MTPYPKIHTLVAVVFIFVSTHLIAQQSNQSQLEVDFDLINKIDLIFNEIKTTEINSTDSRKNIVNDKAEFKIYPTPAKEFFQIDTDLNDFEQVLLTIYSSEGKKISTYDMTSSNFKVDLSEFTSGNYFVLISKENSPLGNPILLTVAK